MDELERYARFRKTMDVGAGTGFASSAYALSRIGMLLGEPDLVRAAGTVAGFIPAAAIDGDEALDVISGAAGAALGFLAVRASLEDGHALSMASRCGARLMERRTVDAETGLGVWITRNGRAETGFAHGQSGIACALLRIAAATGEAALADAAAEALEHERRAAGDGLAATAADSVTAAWSMGATGMGMARLDALGAAGGAESREVVDAALRLSREHLLDGVDDLCSGSMGRVDLLVAAAGRLGRPGQVLRRAERRGGFRTGWGAGYRHPGLFQGDAGVAYGLLRACLPELLPSVLLWD
jgi:lantibiotic modifying enzyme